MTSVSRKSDLDYVEYKTDYAKTNATTTDEDNPYYESLFTSYADRDTDALNCDNFEFGTGSNQYITNMAGNYNLKIKFPGDDDIYPPCYTDVLIDEGYIKLDRANYAMSFIESLLSLIANERKVMLTTSGMVWSEFYEHMFLHVNGQDVTKYSSARTYDDEDTYLINFSKGASSALYTSTQTKELGRRITICINRIIDYIIYAGIDENSTEIPRELVDLLLDLVRIPSSGSDNDGKLHAYSLRTGLLPGIVDNLDEILGHKNNEYLLGPISKYYKGDLIHPVGKYTKISDITVSSTLQRWYPGKCYSNMEKYYYMYDKTGTNQTDYNEDNVNDADEDYESGYVDASEVYKTNSASWNLAATAEWIASDGGFPTSFNSSGPSYVLPFNYARTNLSRCFGPYMKQDITEVYDEYEATTAEEVEDNTAEDSNTTTTTAESFKRQRIKEAMDSTTNEETTTATDNTENNEEGYYYTTEGVDGYYHTTTEDQIYYLDEDNQYYTAANFDEVEDDEEEETEEEDPTEREYSYKADFDESSAVDIMNIFVSDTYLDIDDLIYSSDSLTAGPYTDYYMDKISDYMSSYWSMPNPLNWYTCNYGRLAVAKAGQGIMNFYTGELSETEYRGEYYNLTGDGADTYPGSGYIAAYENGQNDDFTAVKYGYYTYEGQITTSDDNYYWFCDFLPASDERTLFSYTSTTTSSAWNMKIKKKTRCRYQWHCVCCSVTANRIFYKSGKDTSDDKRQYVQEVSYPISFNVYKFNTTNFEKAMTTLGALFTARYEYFITIDFFMCWAHAMTYYDRKLNSTGTDVGYFKCGKKTENNKTTEYNNARYAGGYEIFFGGKCTYNYIDEEYITGLNSYTEDNETRGQYYQIMDRVIEYYPEVPWRNEWLKIRAYHFVNYDQSDTVNKYAYLKDLCNSQNILTYFQTFMENTWSGKYIILDKTIWDIFNDFNSSCNDGYYDSSSFNINIRDHDCLGYRPPNAGIFTIYPNRGKNNDAGWILDGWMDDSDRCRDWQNYGHPKYLNKSNIYAEVAVANGKFSRSTSTKGTEILGYELKNQSDAESKWKKGEIFTESDLVKTTTTTYKYTMNDSTDINADYTYEVFKGKDWGSGWKCSCNQHSIPWHSCRPCSSLGSIIINDIHRIRPFYGSKITGKDSVMINWVSYTPFWFKPFETWYTDVKGNNDIRCNTRDEHYYHNGSKSDTTTKSWHKNSGYSNDSSIPSRLGSFWYPWNASTLTTFWTILQPLHANNIYMDTDFMPVTFTGYYRKGSGFHGTFDFMRIHTRGMSQDEILECITDNNVTTLFSFTKNIYAITRYTIKKWLYYIEYHAYDIIMKIVEEISENRDKLTLIHRFYRFYKPYVDKYHNKWNKNGTLLYSLPFLPLVCVVDNLAEVCDTVKIYKSDRSTDNDHIGIINFEKMSDTCYISNINYEYFNTFIASDEIGLIIPIPKRNNLSVAMLLSDEDWITTSYNGAYCIPFSTDTLSSVISELVNEDVDFVGLCLDEYKDTVASETTLYQTTDNDLAKVPILEFSYDVSSANVITISINTTGSRYMYFFSSKHTTGSNVVFYNAYKKSTLGYTAYMSVISYDTEPTVPAVFSVSANS